MPNGDIVDPAVLGIYKGRDGGWTRGYALGALSSPQLAHYLNFSDLPQPSPDVGYRANDLLAHEVSDITPGRCQLPLWPPGVEHPFR